MAIGCNIWMICLKLNWYYYGLSRMFQLPQFVWARRSSVWDVFINFLLIDATERSKISADQKRFFIALSLYPFSFFANTPFKLIWNHVMSFSTSKCFVFLYLSQFLNKAPYTEAHISLSNGDAGESGYSKVTKQLLYFPVCSPHQVMCYCLSN